MVVITGDAYPGRELRPIDIVCGSAIADFTTTAEISKAGYRDALEAARKEALERMTKAAEGKKADVVTSVRFDTSEITKCVIEVIAYGTANQYKTNINRGINWLDEYNMANPDNPLPAPASGKQENNIKKRDGIQYDDPDHG